MKKTIKMVSLMIALCMVLAVVLAACQDPCKDGHTDADHDGVCDVCKTEGLAVTHTGGTATCQELAKCSVCGKEYGVLADHVDANNDTHCDVCGAYMVPVEGSTKEIWQATSQGYEDQKFYTLNTYTAGTSSLNWNPHTWEENFDSTVLGMITMGFFDFVLSKDGKSYSIVPELATYVPGTTTEGQKFSGALYLDVTSAYEGRFGVKAGETAKAFRIFLNPNATWDDAAHTKITAQSHIYSLQQQLNPQMMNRRADSYYGGDFSIYGAKKYLYSQQEQIFTPVADQYSSIEAAVAAGLNVYFDAAGFWGATNTDEIEGSIDGWVLWNDETLLDDGTPAEEWMSTKAIVEGYMSYLFGDYSQYLCFIEENKDVGYSWDGVGFIAGEQDGVEYLDMIIENSLRMPEFYVPYYNTSTCLVLESLYEDNKVYHYEDGSTTKGEVDPEKKLESVTSVYCNTIETSAGYGPYSFTYFELDKQLVFERNESWYGYSDGMHLGQFQMDKYVIKIIDKHETALLAFLKGEIDDIGLASADMETYGSSSRLSYTPNTYTTKVSFVTDYDALAKRQGDGINKTMLTVEQFRKAFSLSLDRSKFVQANTAGGDVGFGLLNYLYVHDVEGGIAYRETDYGKKAIVDLYGIEYGAGKEYATLNDAYHAVTGYDPSEAKKLYNEAFDYATTHNKLGAVVEAGSAGAIYNGTDTIEIQFDVYSNDTVYVQMFSFFVSSVEEATQGTKLEGKVTFKMVVNPDYYDTIATGSTDIIFSTWGGAQFNGLSVIANCYTDDPTGQGNQMEYGFDCSKINLTINLDLDGSLSYKSYTSSLKNWADWLANRNDADITDANGNKLPVSTTLGIDVLQQVFAEVEREYLSHFVAIPLYYRNDVALDSYKVDSAVKEYVNLVGYGGTRFVTFNYDDTEWAEFIKDSNNLDYTK